MNTRTDRRPDGGCHIIDHDIKTCSRFGVDGKTPYIGDNGHWWIGDRDTETIAGIQPAVMDIDLATGELYITTEILGARFNVEDGNLIAEL